MVLINLGKPILFIQQRPGLHGKPFYLLKFRTMKNIYDEKGKLVPDKERLTDFGRFLRRTSLDELPEIFNVLKGNMSLVGPRPLLMQYLDKYSSEENRRHNVKPGITGWAQVKGRNCLSWAEKFKYDVWYVDNRSLWLDFKILFFTVLTVMSNKGTGESGDENTPYFQGHDDLKEKIKDKNG
jgi:sugar transferase EpsL